ncbi:MAG: MCP four helix bundle domain-containing protein, partial [Ideonella sp.]|nr:MCP four helix bundle domain-containing protein [Ideonella sp.]
MFEQTKLSTKLSLTFALLIALALALGGIVLYQMTRMNAGTLDIAHNWLPSVRKLGEIRNTMNQIRRAESDHLLSADDREREQIDARIDQGKARLVEQLAQYEPLINTPEERKAYGAFHTTREAYLAVLGKLLQLSRGGEASATQAKALFRGESRQAFTEVLAAQEALVEVNTRGSDEAAGDAEATYRGAWAWTVGLLAAMVVLAVATAVVIVRSVTRQ